MFFHQFYHMKDRIANDMANQEFGVFKVRETTD